MSIQERRKATKARISSKEQGGVYSLDDQKYRLQEYCMRKDFEILKTFEFSEYSTIDNCNNFMKVIEFVKSQKEIIAVVSDKIAPMNRIYQETPMLNDLIEHAKIELHFYKENCIIHKYSTLQEKMMWDTFMMIGDSTLGSFQSSEWNLKNESIGK